MRKVSPEYAAGFFDGEGSVCVGEGRTGNGSCLSVTNTTRDALDALAETYGGTVYYYAYRGPRKRAIYEWKVRAAEAEAFAREILPFALVKAEQIQLWLELRQGYGHRWQWPGGKLPAVEVARRTSLISQIKAVRA